VRPDGASQTDLGPIEITRSRAGDALSTVESESEGDELGSALTHPLSLSDANTARVTVRPGYPTLVQSSRHR
jgi:hypothetical protein